MRSRGASLLHVTVDFDQAFRNAVQMATPDSIALVATAETEGLDSLLVGGNAVNLHAYVRTTFDVDLLVR